MKKEPAIRMIINDLRDIHATRKARYEIMAGKKEVGLTKDDV